MSTQLKLIPGTLANGYCPTTEQERYNKYFALGHALLESGTGYTIKVDAPGSPPSASERSTTLFMPNSGNYAGKIFRYTSGYWACPNPVPASSITASSGIRWLVATGTEADIWSLDGGSGDDPSVSAPTAYTGAMWEVDHNYDGRSFMGVGTIPDVAYGLTVGENYGSGNHKIVLDETPEHFHASGAPFNPGFDTPYGATTISPGMTYGFHEVIGSIYEVLNTSSIGEPSGTQESITLVHPVRGTWVIKRTARIYHTL